MRAPRQREAGTASWKSAYSRKPQWSCPVWIRMLPFAFPAEQLAARVDLNRPSVRHQERRGSRPSAGAYSSTSTRAARSTAELRIDLELDGAPRTAHVEQVRVDRHPSVLPPSKITRSPRPTYSTPAASSRPIAWIIFGEMNTVPSNEGPA